ncbi:MAG: hypothetical protein HC827_15315 [Cyanobacteria bacterium RM1_2_2]|nr:hypothetical protein [Cyanobacteria bacterium RM1_2_2]
MTAEEVLQILERTLPPGTLTAIKVLVFQQSWLGKEYATIAREAGYDYSYVREAGADLWRLLSEMLHEPVKKKNFRSILQQRFATESLLHLSQPLMRSLPLAQPSDGVELPEFPGSALPLYSKFYIEHSAVEARCYAEITKPGGLLHLKAPRKMGKSSLLLRIAHHAEGLGYQSVILDLKQTDQKMLADLDKFLRWLCISVTHQLGLEPKLQDYWDEQSGSKASCTLYFTRYLLKQNDAPLILCFNEFDQVLDYPQLAYEVLPLLQSWYEAAKQNAGLQKLRVVLAYATDLCVPLRISQTSLANVGLPIELPEFNPTQVQTLAQQYGFSWQSGQVQQIMAMVGGNPYLVQLAVYHLWSQNITLEQLLQEAPNPSGVYSHHLRHCLTLLHTHADLRAAFQQVLMREGYTDPDPLVSCKLHSLGLVKLDGNEMKISCPLYRLYFQAQLPLEGSINC